MFVRTNKNQQGRVYHYVLHSVYDKKKKRSVHKRIADLSALPEQVVETVRAMLAGKRVVICESTREALSVAKTRLFGPVWIALILWLRLGMSELKCFSRSEFKVLTALVVARTVAPVACRSESSTAQWLQKSALGLIMGNEDRKWHRNEFYPVLTKLSQHWQEVEQTLWHKRGDQPRLYLYDITSTYFEGQGGSLAEFGYSRDKRSDKKQVVVALVADEHGIPVALRFFPGNTRDSTTVSEIVEELKSSFNVGKVVLIMDRGMRTEVNLEKITVEGFKYVMALKHSEARELVKRHNDELQWDLYDQRSIAELYENGKRYVICHSPFTAERDRNTRDRILKRATERLDKLVNMAEKGRIKNRDKIMQRAVKILTQTGAEKYVDYNVDTEFFQYWLRQDRLGLERTYEGCYVLETTVEHETADKKEIDSVYRNQREIEETFKSCKDEMHMRPNGHEKDDNILGHIRLTFLAHTVKKHLEQILHANAWEEKGSTFLQRFTDITANLIDINKNRAQVITELDSEQKKALDITDISMPSGQLRNALYRYLPKRLQCIAQ